MRSIAVVCGSTVITVLHAVLAEAGDDLLRVLGDDLVGAEVVGERAGVQVVLVEVAELDARLPEQPDDVAEDAFVLGALARARPRSHGTEVQHAVDAAAEPGEACKPGVAEPKRARSTMNSIEGTSWYISPV